MPFRLWKDNRGVAAKKLNGVEYPLPLVNISGQVNAGSVVSFTATAGALADPGEGIYRCTTNQECLIAVGPSAVASNLGLNLKETQEVFLYVAAGDSISVVSINTTSGSLRIHPVG